MSISGPLVILGWVIDAFDYLCLNIHFRTITYSKLGSSWKGKISLTSCLLRFVKCKLDLHKEQSYRDKFNFFMQLGVVIGLTARNNFVITKYLHTLIFTVSTCFIYMCCKTKQVFVKHNKISGQQKVRYRVWFPLNNKICYINDHDIHDIDSIELQL